MEEYTIEELEDLLSQANNVNENISNIHKKIDDSFLEQNAKIEKMEEFLNDAKKDQIFR